MVADLIWAVPLTVALLAVVLGLWRMGEFSAETRHRHQWVEEKRVGARTTLFGCKTCPDKCTVTLGGETVEWLAGGWQPAEFGRP